MISKKNSKTKERPGSKSPLEVSKPLRSLDGNPGSSNRAQLAKRPQRRYRTTDATASSDTPDPGPDPIPIPPKLQKRFYEALVLLAVLGRNRGDHLEEEEEFQTEPDPTDLNRDKLLRRSFLRNLAYLCDFDTGGDQTTAFALQQTPQGIVYWLTTNKGSHRDEDKTGAFASEILRVLKDANTSQIASLEECLFEKAVGFSESKISYYAKCLHNEIQHVVKEPSQQQSVADTSFLTWLGSLKRASKTPNAICRLCYDERRSPHYTEVQRRALPGGPCSQKYTNIQHLIGRLNHTLKAVKGMIEARTRLPYLFDDFELKRANSPHSSPPPLLERNPTWMDIAGRLLSDPIEIEQCRQHLRDLDRLHGLSGELEKLCQSKTWKPRVHAELILLDMFWTQDLEFVGNDRYIACSKPACYCCYHFIIAHPGGFVAPACHSNLWLNWKPPEIYDSCETRLIKTRENILDEMAKKIRVDALAQISECRGPRSRKPDSHTEISSLQQHNLTFLSDDAAGSSNESSGDIASSKDSDIENVVSDVKCDRQLKDDDSETEDEEDGGVRLNSALEV